MKKFIGIVLIITIISIFNDFNSNNNIIIPKQSIRFRVIANSDTVKDQELKVKVKDNLEKELSNLLISSNSIDDTRRILNSNIALFEDNIKNTIENENSKEDFSINYGYNYFPEKTYKTVTYKEGKYESLVVTLGDGKGENFWCVLFPPLCQLEKESNDKVEYHILIKDILKKYEKK